MDLRDLLPIDDLSRLCEEFTTLTGAVIAVLDLDGTILIATGWQDICTRFHRRHPVTSQRCRESDTVLAAKLREGEAYNLYRCQNGLVDVAVPIMVMGQHVGNLFTGQFFLEHPDIDAFTAQAQTFGFPTDDYLEAMARVPVFSEGQVRAMMGFLTHLTHLIGDMGMARVQQDIANRELQQSRVLLKTIIDTVPIRVFWKDRMSRYLGANPAFAADAGLSSPEDLIGRDDYDMSWADRAEAYRADDQAVMQSGQPKLFFDEQISTARNGTIWARTSKVPLRNAVGKVIGILSIYEDITQHKAAEQLLKEKNEELLQSNGDLEQFAYISSHDLQTPLRNIVHFAQLLDRRYRGQIDKDADEFIQFIVDSGLQMSRLISDLLEYSRIPRHRRSMKPVSVALAVEHAVRNLAADLALAEATVTLAPALPEVIAESSLLVSLFQNLIGNAIKYRDPDRPLTVSVEATPGDPGFVRLAVSDTGIGIDPAYHEKVFEIFQRLAPSSNREGTGIGLALCRRIVHQCGGAIGLDSSLGSGTTIWFTLRVQPD